MSFAVVKHLPYGLRSRDVAAWGDTMTVASEPLSLRGSVPKLEVRNAVGIAVEVQLPGNRIDVGLAVARSLTNHVLILVPINRGNKLAQNCIHLRGGAGAVTVRTRLMQTSPESGAASQAWAHAALWRLSITLSALALSGLALTY